MEMLLYLKYTLLSATLKCYNNNIYLLQLGWQWLFYMYTEYEIGYY